MLHFHTSLWSLYFSPYLFPYYIPHHPNSPKNYTYSFPTETTTEPPLSNHQNQMTTLRSLYAIP